MAQSRTLVTGGHVVSMDPAIGDLPTGDVLIEDGAIVAVAPSLQVDDAEVVDATGGVVLPGLIDTHRHTWQSVVRGICADWTLGDYYFGIRLAISPAITPEDVRVGQLLGGADALNAGVTTLLDFSHTNNTPAHSDAAIAGIVESGVRAAHCHGFFESRPADPQFGTHDDRVRDLRRLAGQHFPDPRGLVTIGVSLSEVFGQPWQHTLDELAVARELGALVVSHTGCVWGSCVTGGIRELDEAGQLGPDIVHVHCNTLDDDEWAALARTGGKVSISVETELNMGMGRPVFERCRRHGIAPTLSADVISLNSGDLWHEMRFGLGFDRWDATQAVNLAGRMPETVTTTAREALTWTTVNAADAMGMGDRIGSLTPGKRGDVVVVGGDSFEMHPRPDVVGSLVFQTTVADVRTVLVDGRVVKRDGALVDHDLAALGRQADAVCDGLLQRLSDAGVVLPGTPENGWDVMEPLFQANRPQPAVR
ncbi:amidohydrolase family protein [Geodermatophilus sp. FMUSA9-8]|uniref:amidohydrolase family protein n=1 Tax=Geodermatophilus sp. FMUSA9-8 TaxID=3120155 RepID=UPI0030081718